MTRSLIALPCIALLAAVACDGGAPTSPSTLSGGSFSGTGATISGTAVRSTATTSPLTVGVAGTSLSSNVDTSGVFQLGRVPPGDVQLVIADSGARSTVSLSNVEDQEEIELRITIAGGKATVEREVRTKNAGKAGKVVLCHRDDAGHHLIDVSVNAEPAHRAHGDAKPGEPVPTDLSKLFDDACRLIAPVDIKKFTNGQDADVAPGPSIPVGSAVTWTYVVTNRSAFRFTSVAVTDDRGVTVLCPTALAEPGASLTCSGSGTAVQGQYRNVGRVIVTANDHVFTASDPSHYLGVPVVVNPN